MIANGHQVVGLTRSEEGAQALIRAGAGVFQGDINDLNHLRTGIAPVDGIIHTAFNHDFGNMKLHSENDRKVIETLGAALAGSGRPLVITSGTGPVRSKADHPAIETDNHVTSAKYARAASEEAADALITHGGHVIVLRLPQVHDQLKQGRIALHIQLARQKGWVGYVGEGNNRLPAVHVTDAVRLFQAGAGERPSWRTLSRCCRRGCRYA